MLIDADICMGEIMKIVGCGVLTKISEIVAGELCAFAQFNEPTLGVCVGKNGRFAQVGFLTGREIVGDIRNIEPHVTCYSYGIYWTLEVTTEGFSIPIRMKDKPNPRLCIDDTGPKLMFTGGSYADTLFYNLIDTELSERWPDMAVEVEAFKIWQDENARSQPGAKPLFVKEAPAAS